MRITFAACAAVCFFSCSTNDDNNRAPETFGFGREATAEEIAIKDIDIGPDGTGLLHEGKGKALSGAIIYREKCSKCHGEDGTDGPFGALVTDPNDTASTKKTVGNYWPYATTLYDYVNRAMPFDKPGSLTSQEVYDLTAFILYSNKIIDSTMVVDWQTLPKIEMPAKKMFVPDDRKGGPEVR
ncbi:MAG: cytochrome c [Bacteroidota bacterium]